MSGTELESLDRQLAAIESVAVEGLLVVDASGVIVRASRSAESMLDREPGALTGGPLALILAGGETEARSLLACPPRGETELVARGGRPVPVLLQVAAVGDASGSVVIAALGLEVLEREVEQLIATNRRLQAIVGAVPDLMFRLDAEGKLVDFLPAAKGTTEPLMPPERFLGRSFSDVLPSPLGDELQRVVQRAIEQQTIQIHDYRMVYGDSERQFEGRAVPIDGEVVWFAREVTELRRSEAALRASEERFRLMAETTDDVIYMRDDGSRELIYVSPACERVFGRSPESLSAGTDGWLELIHPDARDQVAAALDDILEHAPFDETYRILRDDGEIRWVRDRNFLGPGGGDRRCVVGTVQDITEQMKLEEELRLSQKMDAIGQLASGVAHDFRNLLMGILGCARIARERLDEPEKAHEFLDEIETAAETATTITQQLLEYARRDVRTSTAEPLDDMIAEARVMLRVLLGDEIALVVRLQAGAMVCIDRSELHRVLMNLAANARDAMDSGGRLIIETRRLPGSDAEHPEVLLSVTDTGQGMSESTRRHALEPFFTTKEKGKGTGLGLSAVYAIIRKAGGHTELRSTPGGGTTVELRLPIAEPEGQKPTAANEATSEVELQRSETVLLVEDNDAVRRINMYYLDQAGYRVFEAASGTEAVSLCESLPAPIDIVLTDVMLPGLSGRKVAERVVERHPDARVIYMSAYPTEWLVDEGKLPADVNALHKPFDRRTLLEALGH